MKMHDDFGFDPRAVFEAARDWVKEQTHNVDSPAEPEVIEPGAPGNSSGPSTAPDYVILRAGLEAASVSITDTIEYGQGQRRQTRAIRTRLAKFEMTIESSER
jgi:hypothetical protein